MVHPFIPQISIVYTGSRRLFHFSQQIIIEHLLGARPEQASQESPTWMGEMGAPETFLSTILMLLLLAQGHWACGLLVQWV